MFNRSMTRHALMAALVTLACGAYAEDEAAAPASPHTWSANVGLFTEYVFRGVTNSNEDPAIQGGFDYAHSSGFFAGVWASNIEIDATSGDTASIEIDYYAGFGGSFANGTGWEVGFIYYHYPEQDDEGTADYDYIEGYGTLSHTWEDVSLSPSLEASIYYSPDYFGEDGDGVYVTSTFGITLPHDFAPYVTVGWQDIDGDETSGPAGYDLSWQDATDLTGCDDACEAVVFSITSSW